MAAAQGISTRPNVDNMSMPPDIPGKSISNQVVVPSGGGENQLPTGIPLGDEDAEQQKKREDEAKRKKDEEEKSKEMKILDRSRPISSTPVPGTPW